MYPLTQVAVRPVARLACLALFPLLLAGCGPNTDDPDARTATTSLHASITIDLGEHHQTLEGFGAAIAWYDDWLTNHPNKDEIYELAFGDLGLDILRLRNRFRYQDDFSVESQEIVERGSSSIGRDLTVLMSSWSPPSSLKANAATDCTSGDTCTLRRVDGEFPYREFADYWNDSLDAYAGLGIFPRYISLQNEPDYHPDGWEGCMFKGTETDEFPGYAQALEAVHDKLMGRDAPPKVLGPETIGITNAKVQAYTDEIDLDELDGIAHHLYDGNTWQAPDDFVLTLRSLRAEFKGIPIFQTEFSADAPDGGAFETAWLIHNALTEADAVAYVYWDLIWRWQTGTNPSEGGLVTLENPYTPESWTSSGGFKARGAYYSMRHFSKFTDPGFVRVGATSSTDTLKVSAFASPDEERVTVVVLNTGAAARELTVDAKLSGYDSAVYQSTNDREWRELGALPDGTELTLPARSVTTIAHTRRQ